MTIVVPLDHLLEDVALKEYQSAGGVVDYVPFGVTGAASSDDLHWHAGLEGMQVLVRALHGVAWKPENALPIDARGTAPFRPAYPKPPPPVPVSLDEFVGPFFDRAAQKLVDPWNRSGGGGGSRSSNGEFVTAGYADAFLDPPYSLRVSIDRASSLFTMINAAMFGGLSKNLDVRKWTTDWSDYFDSGKEWWGAFFWTLYAPQFSRVCVVAASSTD